MAAVPDAQTQSSFDMGVQKMKKVYLAKIRGKKDKHTTPGIRWSSPTQLLVRRSLA
jgi:hypothetical protein